MITKRKTFFEENPIQNNGFQSKFAVTHSKTESQRKPDSEQWVSIQLCSDTQQNRKSKKTQLTKMCLNPKITATDYKMRLTPLLALMRKNPSGVIGL